MRRLFAAAEARADTLLLCGDLTANGRTDELRGLLAASGQLDMPTIAVLGNHDHEEDREDEFADILTSVGIDVLDGTPLVIDGVGFAGVKGFGGGFAAGRVEAFGERSLKRFVATTATEVAKLDDALAALQTKIRIVLMHYAPIAGTLVGEPETLWPFLGSSRFEDCIERAGVQAVFHGHAHLGAPRAQTLGGIPVFNVAEPVLRRHGLDLRIWSVQDAVSSGITDAEVR